MHPEFEQLVQLFKQFPGIGARQARRFVYFILQQPDSYTRRLVEQVQNTRKRFHLCTESFQYFFDENPNETRSPLVRNEARTKELLMVVLKDMDLEAIEQSRVYTGQYFVLGGFIPMIETKTNDAVRMTELLALIQKRAEHDKLAEIILAFPLNPEGEHTRAYVTAKIEDLKKQYHLKISTLGRGLSTGTELEYIDRDTFQNAFEGRR